MLPVRMAVVAGLRVIAIATDVAVLGIRLALSMFMAVEAGEILGASRVVARGARRIVIAG